MAKKNFSFKDTSVSEDEAKRRLQSIGLAPAPGPVAKKTATAKKTTIRKQTAAPDTTKPNDAATVAPPVRQPAKYRGVPDEFIRFSYIVREDYHETMRAMAKEKGVSIRLILDQALLQTVGKYVDDYQQLPTREEQEKSNEAEIKGLF